MLPKYNTVIFINGCFWHKHEGCKYFVWPKSNEDFWRNKIEKNVSRDKVKIKELEKQGWNVITIWECQLKKDRDRVLDDLVNQLLMYNKQYYDK